MFGAKTFLVYLPLRGGHSFLSFLVISAKYNLQLYSHYNRLQNVLIYTILAKFWSFKERKSQAFFFAAAPTPCMAAIVFQIFLCVDRTASAKVDLKRFLYAKMMRPLLLSSTQKVWSSFSLDITLWLVTKANLSVRRTDSKLVQIKSRLNLIQPNQGEIIQ